jgi:hypothetical protein
VSTPAAACQRRSKLRWSLASASLRPSRGLEEHHRRHDPGRDGRSPSHGLLVEIGEVVVIEELVTAVGQESIDRTRLQPVTEDLPRTLDALLGL